VPWPRFAHGEGENLTIFFLKLVNNLLLILAVVICCPCTLTAQEPDPQVAENLKTIHSAFEAYRKDHGGAYPPLLVISEDERSVFWPELLKPYLDDDSPPGQVELQGVFFAPYVPDEERRGGRASTVSFGYNRFGLGRDAGGKSGVWRREVTDVPDPDNTILLAEVDAPSQPGTGWHAAWADESLDYERYEGKSHVLFASGRIALLSPEELIVTGSPETNQAPWYGDLSK